MKILDDIIEQLESSIMNSNDVIVFGNMKLKIPDKLDTPITWMDRLLTGWYASIRYKGYDFDFYHDKAYPYEIRAHDDYNVITALNIK